MMLCIMYAASLARFRRRGLHPRLPKNGAAARAALTIMTGDPVILFSWAQLNSHIRRWHTRFCSENCIGLATSQTGEN